jgi:hypothetical protein
MNSGSRWHKCCPGMINAPRNVSPGTLSPPTLGARLSRSRLRLGPEPSPGDALVSSDSTEVNSRTLWLTRAKKVAAEHSVDNRY